MAFAIADVELGRRVTAAWAATKADPWAGRRLRGWLVAAGLEPEEHRSRCCTPTIATATPSSSTTGPTSAGCIERRGLLPAEDLDRFDREVDAAEAAGAYGFALVRHGWRARRR